MEDDFAFSTPSTYSKDNFYIAASDSKGHNVALRVKVPPQTAGELASIVASRVFPTYRTSHDFVRDAIVHRVHDIAEMVKDAAPVMSGQLELLFRALAVEAELAAEELRLATDQRIHDAAMRIMSHSPQLGTMDNLRRAISQITEPELKVDLRRMFERYEARYDG